MSLIDFPKGIEAQANAAINDLIDSLASIQPGYRAMHGRYWQGVRTPQGTPANGAVLETDKDRKPSDQDESWYDAGAALPDSSLISVAVHVYDGPSGQGYDLEGRIELGGSIWQRVAHTGVESWRERDWIEIEEGSN